MTHWQGKGKILVVFKPRYTLKPVTDPCLFQIKEEYNIVFCLWIWIVNHSSWQSGRCLSQILRFDFRKVISIMVTLVSSLLLCPLAICQAAGSEGRNPWHPGGAYQRAPGAGTDPERAHQRPQTQVWSLPIILLAWQKDINQYYIYYEHHLLCQRREHKLCPTGIWFHAVRHCHN